MEFIDIIIIACIIPFLLAGIVMFIGGIWDRELEIVLFGILMLLPLSIGISQGIKDKSKITTIPIVSLERGQEINGSFILGFGGVSTSVVYYAYEDLGNNSYSLLNMNSGGGDNRLILKEDSSKKPSYIVERRCGGGIFKFCKPYRTLIVPNNTIQKEFKG